jgi:NAD(P)-dependent dehydrogenase (short-subunit alcohol dehydrogenase family)
MGRLDGKVALVFGAGPNIGGTIAHCLAKEGASIAVTDLVPATAEDTARFLTERSYTAEPFAGNATVEEDVARVVRQAVERFGHVDTMLNLAGGVAWGDVTSMEVGEFQRCITSFLTAGFLTTKYAARAMLEGERRGCLIHLLSTAAHFGEAAGAAYCAAKAGLLNFARSAAMDLAHRGIRVNTITPCALEHQLWTNMRDEMTRGVPPRTRSFYSRDEYLKNIPLARFPRALDLGWAAVYLASDEAEFLTGVDIPVDGGLRFKYPTWRPGDFTGANIDDYLAHLQITRYGEPVGDFWQSVGGREEASSAERAG